MKLKLRELDDIAPADAFMANTLLFSRKPGQKVRATRSRRGGGGKNSTGGIIENGRFMDLTESERLRQKEQKRVAQEARLLQVTPLELRRPMIFVTKRGVAVKVSGGEGDDDDDDDDDVYSEKG